MLVRYVCFLASGKEFTYGTHSNRILQEVHNIVRSNLSGLGVCYGKYLHDDDNDDDDDDDDDGNKTT